MTDIDESVDVELLPVQDGGELEDLGEDYDLQPPGGTAEETATTHAIRGQLYQQARGAYQRATASRWTKTSIHGFMICPQCGALVADLQGKILHQEYHGNSGPPVRAILQELERALEEARGLLEDG